MSNPNTEQLILCLFGLLLCFGSSLWLCWLACGFPSPPLLARLLPCLAWLGSAFSALLPLCIILLLSSCSWRVARSICSNVGAIIVYHQLMLSSSVGTLVLHGSAVAHAHRHRHIADTTESPPSPKGTKGRASSGTAPQTTTHSTTSKEGHAITAPQHNDAQSALPFTTALHKPRASEHARTGQKKSSHAQRLHNIDDHCKQQRPCSRSTFGRKHE